MLQPALKATFSDIRRRTRPYVVEVDYSLREVSSTDSILLTCSRLRWAQ